MSFSISSPPECYLFFVTCLSICFQQTGAPSPWSGPQKWEQGPVLQWEGGIGGDSTNEASYGFYQYAMKKDDLAAITIIQTDTLRIKTRKELGNNQQKHEFFHEFCEFKLLFVSSQPLWLLNCGFLINTWLQNWLFSFFAWNFYTQYPTMTTWKKLLWIFCKFDKNKQKTYNMYRCIQPLLTIMQAYCV